MWVSKRRMAAGSAIVAILGISPLSAVPPAWAHAGLGELSAGTATALTGQVANNGKPVLNADVVVVAWPNQDLLEAVPDGGKVETQIVATAKTDDTGAFAIDLDPAGLPKEIVSDSGQMDVDVIVADATQETERSLSIVSTTTGWTSTEELASASMDPGPVDLLFDLGTGKFESSVITQTDLDADPELLSDEEGLALEPAAAPGFNTTPLTSRDRIDQLLAERGGAVGVTPMEECYQIGTSSYQSQRAESFAIAQGVVNAKVRVTQGSGTSHSLGVAVNFGGGWKGSGSTTKTTSSSASQSGISTARRYYNRVKYRYYTNSCGVAYGYRWRPYSIQELVAGYVLVSRLNYSSCSTQGNGYEYTKNRGRNTTYGTGVDLAQVNVSAQSGYNSDTSLTWDFTGTAKICWSSASAGREGSSRVITKVP